MISIIFSSERRARIFYVNDGVNSKSMHFSFEATCPPLSMALKSLAIYPCYSSRCEHALLENLY
jgi:hypothetical protein